MNQLFDTNQYKKIFLSPSKLNLFQDCPLCFWLQEVKGIHRPEGPTSTLPRGMDLLIKDYFDKYRKINEVPPEIRGQVRGKLLPDGELLTCWRNWRSGLKYEDSQLNVIFSGALDECFVEGDYYIPVDYKTRGFELKEDSLKYYQLQMDSYTFLLEASGYKHLNFGYLIYFIPEKIQENGTVSFTVEAHEIKTNPQNALNLFRQAVEVLRRPKPEGQSDCQFCSWGNEFLKFK